MFDLEFDFDACTIGNRLRLLESNLARGYRIEWRYFIRGDMGSSHAQEPVAICPADLRPQEPIGQLKEVTDQLALDTLGQGVLVELHFIAMVGGAALVFIKGHHQPLGIRKAILVVFNYHVSRDCVRHRVAPREEVLDLGPVGIVELSGPNTQPVGLASPDEAPPRLLMISNWKSDMWTGAAPGGASEEA